MSRKAMAAIGLVVVVVLGVAGFLVDGPLLALGGVVVGALAVVVVLRRTADRVDLDDEEPTEPRRTRRSSPSAPAASADTLLPTWTPPAEVEPQPEPVSSWDENWTPGDGWSEGGVDTAEANPLDELESLDDVDVIAEVERIESLDTGTGLDDVVVEEVEVEVEEVEVDEGPALDADGFPVKEDVETADDIMAASQATELTVDGGDNTELAKLLAKVQARLAAYE